MNKHEGNFTAVSDPDMPKGCAAVVRDDRLIMIGPVRDMHVERGDKLVLNPADFDVLNSYMNRQLH